MAIYAFFFSTLAMGPAYLIRRYRVGLKWSAIAYVAGFLITLTVAVILAFFTTGLPRLNGSPIFVEQIGYRCGKNFIPTIAAAALGPLGAAVSTIGQKENPSDMVGLVIDYALFLPLAGLLWGRRMNQRAIKRALEVPDKTE